MVGRQECLRTWKLFDVIHRPFFRSGPVITPFLQMQKTEEMASGAAGLGRKPTDAMTEVLGDTRVIVGRHRTKGRASGRKKLKTKTGWPGIKILMFAF